MSRATAWRYVDETLDVLVSWAPGLHEALTASVRATTSSLTAL